jgi:hypothetical protein
MSALTVVGIVLVMALASAVAAAPMKVTVGVRQGAEHGLRCVAFSMNVDTKVR